MKTKYQIGQLIKVAGSDCMLFRVNMIVLNIRRSGIDTAYVGRVWRCWKDDNVIKDYPTKELVLAEHELGEVVKT